MHYSEASEGVWPSKFTLPWKEKQEEAKNSLPFILHGLHPRPHHDGGEVPRQVASCWLVLSNSFYKSLPTEKLRYALFTLLLRLLPTSISNRVSDQCKECTLDNNLSAKN